MSTINPLTREVSAKIVYVGPGLSGKTTCLQFVHSRLAPDRRGDLISLATDEDRTLFFDFLPVKVPQVNGMGVRLHLYTVPGQVFYAATRNLVLTGADGVVFVADAQSARLEANIQSLESTREQLEEHGVDLSRFPLVFQYNKRDLPDTLTTEELRRELNPQGFPDFDTIAKDGVGVLEALRQSVRGVIRSLSKGAPPSEQFVRKTQDRISETSIAKRIAHLVEDAEAQALPPIGLPPPPQSTRGATKTAPSPRGFEDLPLMPRGSTASRPVSVSEFDEDIAFEPELLESAAQEHVTTERPVAGVSFGELWDPSARAPIGLIESCITASRYNDAVHHVASALATLLDRMPVPAVTGMGTRATLLGLNGPEYLRLCRLASQPAESINHADALFALYLLIAARVKLTAATRAM